MKISVKANKADDLRREKQQWQMKYDARKQLYEDQEANYRTAEWNWQDNIVNLIKQQFSSYIEKLPFLDINVDYGWRNIEVRFKYADWIGRDDRDKVSLRWSYDISLSEEGDVKKETNSWSGFEAVTPQQVDDLMNSANFLKAIVDFDWAPLLNEAKETRPKYSQYIGIRDPRSDDNFRDPGYDKMIKEAELEELLNSGKWIKINSDWGSGRWAYIISETPKFYTYTTLGDYEITHATPENTNMEQLISHITDPENTSQYYTDRIKKDKLKVANPIETKTSEELVAMIGTAVQ